MFAINDSPWFTGHPVIAARVARIICVQESGAHVQREAEPEPEPGEGCTFLFVFEVTFSSL